MNESKTVFEAKPRKSTIGKSEQRKPYIIFLKT